MPRDNLSACCLMIAPFDGAGPSPLSVSWLEGLRGVLRER